MATHVTTEETIPELYIDRIASNGATRSTTNGRSADAHPAPARKRAAGRQAARRSTVSLVVPAKNEARNIATVLEHLPDCVDEVILVDGRSSDVTRLMAESCLPDIRIISESHPGKGNALRAGFAAAQCDVIVAMDADGSMSPAEIPQFVYFLDHGFDFVKGSRFVGGGGSLDITPLRKLGNRGLLMLANRFFDSQLTDLCYGFFAFRRRYLGHLGLSSEGFEIETELTVRALTSGLRVAEVPSLEMPRRSGNSSLRAFHDGLRVLRTLLDERAKAPSQSPVERMRPVPASPGDLRA
jgi:glycosyltransferase involved in cell wall biosynthesis